MKNRRCICNCHDPVWREVTGSKEDFDCNVCMYELHKEAIEIKENYFEFRELDDDTLSEILIGKKFRET